MKSSRAHLRLNRIASWKATQAILLIGFTLNATARDYFNPALLELGSPKLRSVDLSSFGNPGGQVPGVYHVDIFVNNEKIETRNVEFRIDEDAQGEKSLSPCLSTDDLARWGVLVEKFPSFGVSDSNCVRLKSIPQASAEFRFNTQQLLLSFPQSALNNSARGWVDPKLWDEGITSALLNYGITGANLYAENDGVSDSSSQYLNLRPGLNVGPWRLRNYTTWNRSNNRRFNSADDHWNTVYSYAQRNLVSLQSQLTLGDSSTEADVFDSVPFRGAQLASDDEMIAESLRGYAPVVRGIARTNAQVTVRQNGYIIYQTYVSPGSFEITDMYPTGGSGDLNVTITESDGSEQKLIIPYASLPILQREGRLKYAMATGVYRSYDRRVEQSPLTEGSVIYGLPGGFTAYGGSQLSNRYQSVALGIGKNLGEFGAVSVDDTQAWGKPKGDKRESGQSWRLRYSKNFVGTGTNFAIAGYRYATDGYRGMEEVLDTYTSENNHPVQERRRNRTELTLSQELWKEGGNLGLSMVREDYWKSDQRKESYSASYNNFWNGISYGIGYTYNRNLSTDYSLISYARDRTFNKDQIVSFNLSMPLTTLFGNNHPVYANYIANSSKTGNSTNSLSLSGTTLEDNNLSWSAQQGYGSQGQGNSGSINANWRAPYGEINGGYSYDRNSQRINYGIQGGILAHEDGITLGQSLGETVVLVAAPGATDVAVQSQTGIKTDYRGYAIVPYASPYRRDSVTLNTETLNDNTDIAITTQTVIPTRGAVVKANYKVSIGQRVLLELKTKNGQPIPFGAKVKVSNSESQAFIVGDNGQVYVTGLDQHNKLDIKWGSTKDEHCSVDFLLPISEEKNAIMNITETCQ